MSATRTRCWACGEPVRATSAFEFGFEQCDECGLVFRPAAADGVAELYEGEDYFDGYFADGYLTDEPQRVREAAVRLEWVLDHAQRGRLFEVGAAAGVFLAAAGERGFEVSGVEPSPGMARTARERFGVEVEAGLVEDVDRPEESFEVICGWHVLEHIPQPEPALERIRELLVGGGLLFLEVPNFASVAATRQRERWFHFQHEVHVAQYGPRSLRSLLERSGFEIVDVRSVSPLAYVGLKRALGPRGVAARLKEAAAVPPWRRASGRSELELLRVVARRPGA
jgi:SAM-dependent methyltransferase